MNDQTQQSPQQTAQPVQTPAATTRRYVRPRANITENASGFVVQVEMPGVSRQGLEITFENGELTLLGHRQLAAVLAGAEALYRESRPADFRRVFEVDGSIDAAHIRAGLDQGLLTLTLPKAEAAKPRKIEINGLN